MKRILCVDDKGRVTIPSDVRKMVGVRRFVRMSVEGNRIVLEPIKDAWEELSELVIKVRVKASIQPSKLSEIAYTQLVKETEREN